MATTESWTASTTWVCPAGVTSLLTVTCRGKGGDGGANASGKTGGGGGGYSSSSNISVTPGDSYTITVDSTKSAFGSDVVRANAGPNGLNDQSTTSGASTTNAVGTVKYGGGNAGYVWTTEGGGGGGAGGPSGTGGNGNGKTAGTGNGTGAGNGGAGGLNNVAGGNGNQYGGGGGGGGAGKSSGTGAAGLVEITYNRVVTLVADVLALEVSGPAAGLFHNRKLVAEASEIVVQAIETDAIYPAPQYRVRLLPSSGSAIDVTAETLEATWERSISNYQRGFESGTADLVFANDLGSLSPLRIAGSAVRPNMGITIEARPSSYDNFATLFTGAVDRIKVNPAIEAPRNVIFSCRDKWKSLARRRVDTGISTNINVGSLVAAVLEDADITPRSIDPIGQDFPFAWFTDRQVTGVIEEIIVAGGYAAYVANDGTFRFRDRFWDIGLDVVGSYQAFTNMSWEIDESDVVNRIRVEGIPRVIVNSVQPIATMREILSFDAGQARGFFLSYEDPRNNDEAPAVEVVNPVASLDYQFNTQADGSGSMITSSLAVSFFSFAETCVQTLTNYSGGTGYLTLYQVRGKPVQQDLPLSIVAELIESQSLYEIKDATLQTRLLGTTDRLTGRAADIIDLFGVPTPKITMSLTNLWPDIIDHDLADVIHVTEAHSGVSHQYTIQQVNHQLMAADRGWAHQVTYALEFSKAVDVFIISSSLSGIIGTNRLGRVTST